MNYYVIWPDGRRFGPADLATLNSWVRENRLTATMELEEEGTGRRLPAGTLPGLLFAAQADWSQPPTPSTYYRQQAPAASPNQGNIVAAWVLGAVTFAVCCPILPIIGLICANKVIATGDPSGRAPRIFNIVVLCLSSLYAIGMILFFTMGMVGSFH